jgi:integrase/recombinase XerD
MTELRENKIADMTAAGLSTSTKEVYVQGVRRGLAAYYHCLPDQLGEGEVRSYLLYLRDERGVARGTYAPHHAGIQFLYTHSLDRDWSLFEMEFTHPSADACPMFPPMPRRARSLAA